MADGGLFEALYGNPPPPYSPRLIGFVDILGWTALTRDPKETDLALVENGLAALKWTEEMEQQRRGDFEERAFPWGTSIRRTNFSDCTVFSCSPLFYEAWWLTRRIRYECEGLLHAGHYTRGAIALGNVRHDEGTVYGPGLIEAIHLERSVAVYPRIVVTDSAAQILAVQRPSPDSDEGWSPLVQDADGLSFLELFRRERDGTRLPLIKESAAQIREMVVGDLTRTRDASQKPYSDQCVALNHRAKFSWMLRYVDGVLADPTMTVPEPKK